MFIPHYTLDKRGIMGYNTSKARRCAMNDDILTKIATLEDQIAELPIGSISKKTVRGKIYHYHRFREDGARKEKYIPEDEVEALREQTERRKALQAKLKALKKLVPKKKTASKKHDFITNVRIGDSLRSYASAVRGYKKRNCYEQLHEYVYGDSTDRVFILFGLRRTGKTTLIRQILADMSDTDLKIAAFIQVTARNTLVDINKDLKYLEQNGFKYIFIDEVTLMSDFIEGAALFSDVFATCGMKIVLSGTDSLGFLFSEDEQLYDRYYQVHTTHIPYREFEEILGIKGIDEYIRHGGTMSLGGVHYNETSTFASKQSADEYVDSAIARNIQHSLKCYQYEGHFRNLRGLYEKNELTNAINRVVEYINNAFALRVLTAEFESHDFGRSANNLRRSGNDILDRVDKAALTERLKQQLEIRNLPELSVPLQEVHLKEIIEYLIKLDLVHRIAERSSESSGTQTHRLGVAQPGLRYAQADALVATLLQDQAFGALSLTEKNAVLERIRNEIKGRMMEDIILLETQLANPRKEVFALHFAIGEFDMVVFDSAAASCAIYEIKHSTEVVSAQYRHLVDEEKCKTTEFHFGPITGKYVIYRGETQDVNGIHYLNVEEYLKGLGR